MPSPRISLAQLHRATGAARPAPPAQAPFSGQWRFDLQQVDGSSHPTVADLSDRQGALTADEQQAVKATTEHIVEHFPAGSLGKLVLLTDCMSPVSGFEALYQDFVAEMGARGLRLASSGEMLPELIANAGQHRA